MMKQKVGSPGNAPAKARRGLAKAGLFTALAVAGLSQTQAANYTLATQQAAGPDWNSNVWLPGTLGAAAIVATDADATFEVLAGARLRSPNNGVDDVFPGKVLLVDGNSVIAPTGSGATTSEIRFKQGGGAAGSGAVTFPQLVLNGGQLDTGNDGTIVINGALEVRKESSLINDGTNDRGQLINAYLSGTGTLNVSTYASGNFQVNATHNINVAGATNTFSGQWNVIRGALLGTGAGSLGTNSITIGAQGALQATYPINNPKGLLRLDGRMYLTQAHKFRAATVNGTLLSPGVHTFDELTAQFPNQFPASWTTLLGSEDDTAQGPRGSIEVLEEVGVSITTPLPAAKNVAVGGAMSLTVGVFGPISSIQWTSNNVALAGATNLTYTSPTLAASAEGAVYKVTVQSALNSVQSSTTVHLVSNPTEITLAVQQASGTSWDSTGSWSDGQSASVSALTGAVYRTLPGARLRNPDGASESTFPGSILTMDGSGVWVNNPGVGESTTSELRFKQGGDGKVTFPLLIMNGGQLDAGNAGSVHVAGQIVIQKNMSFYSDAAEDRGFVIEALLSGSKTIEYHGYNAATLNPSYTRSLTIANSSNTFSGQWNIVLGTLLSTAPGSLGTNDITIGEQGAFETTYNLTNLNGSLYLKGRIYLHQTNTFKSMIVGTNIVQPGTYTFADLSTQYPDQFPAVWTPQLGGAATAEGSGSITVLSINTTPVALVVPPADVRVLLGQAATFVAQITGPATSIQWFKNDVAIDGATSLTYTTDPIADTDNNAVYKVVIGNNVNSVTASAKVVIGQLVQSKGFLKNEIYIGTAYTKDSIQFTTDTPSRVRYISTFETASNQSDNYAEKVSGLFTPTVTGDYIFFIASDDDSYLYLSTDANPDNKVLIATQTGYSVVRGYSTDGNAADDEPTRTLMIANKRSDQYLQSIQGAAEPVLIHLVKDTAYYIEADHHDGTGGDNLAVTFILAGAAIPAEGSAPTLAGLSLSAQSVDGTPLSITAPVAQTVSAGTNATFTVVATSTSTNIFYQWQKNGVDIAGANSASYTTPTLAAGDDADYRVIVSAPGAALQTSANAHLTVSGAVTPTAANITNVTLSAGAVHFTFATQVAVSYTVEYKVALSDATWTTLRVVPGTGATVTVDDTIGAGTRFYRVTAR